MPKRAPDPRELLPLTPVVLHILLALADDAVPGKHGYAVAQEVEALTDGQIRMGPGTLYGSIQRLLGTGLIAESSNGARRGVADDDARRRYYGLTTLGRRALELELARLDHVVRAARRKRLLPEIA